MSSGLRSSAAPFAAGRPLSGQHCSQGAAGSTTRGVELAAATGEVGDGEDSTVFGPPQVATVSVAASRNESPLMLAGLTRICLDCNLRPWLRLSGAAFAAPSVTSAPG